MKRLLSAWSLGTVAVVLAGILAMPRAARGQDNRSTGSEGPQPSVAAPPPAPPPPPPPPRAQAPSTQSGGGGGRSFGGESGRGQDSAVPRGGDRIDRQRGSNDPDTNGPGRRRGGLPKTGEAVARTSPPQGRGNGGSVVIAPAYGGFAPWGPGYGGYYGGGYYGGYYGAYDPWYGWYPTYALSTSSYDDEGSLRLKVKPAEASVYVDGYYVGVVDDFDGIFQRLHVESGPHRIEMRAPGYETLTFDVRIDPDHTTTYRGELEKRKTENGERETRN